MTRASSFFVKLDIWMKSEMRGKLLTLHRHRRGSRILRKIAVTEDDWMHSSRKRISNPIPKSIERTSIFPEPLFVQSSTPVALPLTPFVEEIEKSSDLSSKPPSSKQAEVVKSRTASTPVETKPKTKSSKPETSTVSYRSYITKEEIPLQLIEAGPMKSKIENAETLTHHCFFKILMPELKV